MSFPTLFLTQTAKRPTLAAIAAHLHHAFEVVEVSLEAALALAEGAPGTGQTLEVGDEVLILCDRKQAHPGEYQQLAEVARQGARRCVVTLISNRRELETNAELSRLASDQERFRFYRLPHGRALDQGVAMFLPGAPRRVTWPAADLGSHLEPVFVDQRMTLDRLGLAAQISRLLRDRGISVETMVLESTGSVALLLIKGRFIADGSPRQWTREVHERALASLEARLDQVAPPLEGHFVLDETSEVLRALRGPRRKRIEVGWWKWRRLPFVPGILAAVAPAMSAKGLRMRRVAVETLFSHGRETVQTLEITAEIPSIAYPTEDPTRPLDDAEAQATFKALTQALSQLIADKADLDARPTPLAQLLSRNRPEEGPEEGLEQ